MSKLDKFTQDISIKVGRLEQAVNNVQQLRKESREDFQEFRKEQKDLLTDILSTTEMTRQTVVGHELRIKATEGFAEDIRGIRTRIWGFVSLMFAGIFTAWLRK